MKVKQLSLFLENKPGSLSRPVSLLAKANINIVTLSLADTQQFGILRLIVRDWEAAKALFEGEGLVVNVTDMVAVEVADEPGGLARILAVVENSGVNVEYMYGFTMKLENKGILAFRFNNPDRAVEALKAAGLNPVQSVDLFKRIEG